MYISFILFILFTYKRLTDPGVCCVGFRWISLHRPTMTPAPTPVPAMNWSGTSHILATSSASSLPTTGIPVPSCSNVRYV